MGSFATVQEGTPKGAPKTPRLTEATIRNTRPETGDALLSDRGCLFLRVRATSKGPSRGWIVRIKRNATRRIRSIGSQPDITIKEARATAAHIVAVERGTARVEVRQAVETYVDDIIRPKYRRLANAEVYARRLQNRLGTLAIDAVRPCDVSRMVADYARAAPVASRTACRSSNEAANDDAAGYALLAALALTVAFLTAQKGHCATG